MRLLNYFGKRRRIRQRMLALEKEIGKRTCQTLELLSVKEEEGRRSSFPSIKLPKPDFDVFEAWGKMITDIKEENDPRFKEALRNSGILPLKRAHARMKKLIN